MVEGLIPAMLSITVTLENDRIVLPLNYNSSIQGCIYNMLRQEDPDYTSFIHDEGNPNSNRNFKPFTFTRFRKSGPVENGRVELKGNLEFEVRSADDHFIEMLQQSLERFGIVELNHNLVKVFSYTLNQYRILGTEANIMMIDPLTVHETLENGQTHYFEPNETEFYTRLEANAIKRYAAFYPSDPEQMLQIRPVHVSDKDKSVSRFRDTYISGWRGIYHLTASQDMLHFLYYTGLGERTAQGYGVFRVM